MKRSDNHSLHLSEQINLYPSRIKDIDAWRGFVIIIMALDHSRDFFDENSLQFSATNLDKTYTALFLTRIVSHLCAPTFVFLAGISAYLFTKYRSRSHAFVYLFARGIWLVIIDMALISPVWTHEIGKWGLDTLSAIGFGLIFLSILLPLSRKSIFYIGVFILLFHNILDNHKSAGLFCFGQFWYLLHERGPLPFGLYGQVNYPILPWVGLMLASYGIGNLFDSQRDWRPTTIIYGSVMLIFFVVLRFINVYGDPAPWKSYPENLLTFLSFINLNKYPPSLDFILFTIGVSLLGLSFVQRLGGKIYNILVVYGRASFFFYITHLYLLIIFVLLFESAKGNSYDKVIAYISGDDLKINYGAGLIGSYIFWILTIVSLFPLVRIFGKLKKQKHKWWIYFL